MVRPAARPTFALALAGEPAAFFAALRTALAERKGAVSGQVFGDEAILRIRHEDRRIWSPALHLRTTPGEGGGTLLRGQFAPSSPVWTAFVGIYIALLCLLAAALCYGCAQLTLGRPPWALAGIPVALALGAFTYGAAFIGQGLGADDMHEMRSFVERVAAHQPWSGRSSGSS